MNQKIKILFDQIIQTIHSTTTNGLEGMFEEEFLINLGLDESAVQEFLKSEHTGVVREAARLVFGEQIMQATIDVILLISGSSDSDDEPRPNLGLADLDTNKIISNTELYYDYCQHLRRKGMRV
jgi:hypothetical protein